MSLSTRMVSAEIVAYQRDSPHSLAFHSDESIHVCNRGYLSLFPLLLQLIPADSPHLGKVLELISSKDHLWSPYGLRSLSASHPLFGKDENYWRGPIWVPMNFMVLGALKKKYMVEEGPVKAVATTIYNELRKNIVENVFKVGLDGNSFGPEQSG